MVQWWTARRSAQDQLERLRGILSLAYASTAYYRQVFRAAGFKPDDLAHIEDVTRLPTLDRRAVIEHGAEMCCIDAARGRVDRVSTGGTSGSPVYFLIGANRSAVEYAYLISSWRRAGYELGLPHAELRGRVVSKDRGGLRHEYDAILRRHYYSAYHNTDCDLATYCGHMRTIGEFFLSGYPSACNRLVRFLEASGMPRLENLRGVLAGSETVYPEDRERAERVLGVRYFSWYGQSEKVVLAAECEYSSDYHVWPTYGYFELLDEDGKAVTTPGQRGEIVGTGFINTVMPFIRYRTGDFATYVGDHCEACGRQHTIIRDIRGHRTQEMLVAGDGSLISWTALNMHDDTFDAVRQFQFVQHAAGSATLKIVPASGFGEENLKRIRRNMGRKLDGRIQFDVCCVESIPLTQAGKTTYVDQKLDIDSIAAGAGV